MSSACEHHFNHASILLSTFCSKTRLCHTCRSAAKVAQSNNGSQETAEGEFQDWVLQGSGLVTNNADIYIERGARELSGRRKLVAAARPTRATKKNHVQCAVFVLPARRRRPSTQPPAKRGHQRVRARGAGAGAARAHGFQLQPIFKSHNSPIFRNATGITCAAQSLVYRSESTAAASRQAVTARCHPA